MNFWRDLLGDIKRIAILHDDVRRLETQVDKLNDRVSQHGERLARIEGMIGWVQSTAPPSRPPRLPKG